VGTGEGEATLPVVKLEPEFRGRPRLARVAIIATLLPKDPGVRVGVTGATPFIAGPRVGSGPHFTTPEREVCTGGTGGRIVAALARGSFMGSLQRESCAPVIEGAFHPALSQAAPSFRHMASRARSRQSPPVGILMARSTVRRVHRTIEESLALGAGPPPVMTRPTLDFPMATLQGIGSPGMIKLRSSLPSLFIVTSCASLVSELISMRIVTLMAHRTVCAQAQERPLQGAPSPFEIPYFLGDDELRPVTGPALGLPVFSSEGVAGRVMGEGLCIEMHHPEIFS
jgi:hypothetical protein